MQQSVSVDFRFGKRKTVNMNEEIAQELNRLANSQGKTLYSLKNEIGMSALEANKHGFSLDDAIKGKRLLERAKRSRMILVNQDPSSFEELVPFMSRAPLVSESVVGLIPVLGCPESPGHAQ